MAKKSGVKLENAFGSINQAAAKSGLSAPETTLLNEQSKAETVGERIVLIRREQLIDNPGNQAIYDLEDVETIGRDIKRRGIQEPLLVRQRPDGKYVITSGHKRKHGNDYAVDQLGYKDGEYLPCIVRANVTDVISEKEALILDNLQRVKSDYTRMMEIVELKACAVERQNRGEDLPSLREYIIDRLGVSNSEITRFDKIYNTLIPELMEQFRKQRFSTNVAHSIATGADEDAQKYIYEHWDWQGMDDDRRPLILTYPEMERLMVAYAAEKRKKKAPSQKTEPVAPVAKVNFQSVGEGYKALDKTYPLFAEKLKQVSEMKLSGAEEKRLAKKAGRVYDAIAALQAEIDALSAKPAEGDQDET